MTDKETEQEYSSIYNLCSLGHNYNCACRQVWGNGECECDPVIRLEREKAELVEALERLCESVRYIEVTSQWYKTIKEVKKAEQNAENTLVRIKEE